MKHEMPRNRRNILQYVVTIKKYQKHILYIHSAIQKIMEIKFEMKPHFFLLHRILEKISHKKSHNLLSFCMLTAARMYFVHHWKEDTSLKISLWKLKPGEYGKEQSEIENDQKK